jgi:hypothetical protein
MLNELSTVVNIITGRAGPVTPKAQPFVGRQLIDFTYVYLSAEFTLSIRKVSFEIAKSCIFKSPSFGLCVRIRNIAGIAV